MDAAVAIPDEALLGEFRALLGESGVAAGGEIEPRHMSDWQVTAGPHDRPAAVVFPRTTADVAGILKLCHARGIPVVAQGGLTGLVGAATPVGGCVVLAMGRMRAIEELDPAASTITVQAGVPLQAIQEAAEAAGLLYPMDIGSRGSCLIGGNVSTNAGGVRVLRYGMTRDLVLGLEAVLADGTVVTSLNKMQKNNTGYDLKQLFIGSEGTLGVVTRVVLRLFPKPASVATAFLAFEDYDAVLAFLARARAGLGGMLSAFEVLWPRFYRIATEAFSRSGPLPAGEFLYVLIEAMGTDPARDEAQFAAVIEAALEAGVVADAVIAQNGRQVREIWDIRDSVAEFGRTFHPHVGFDISIPTGQIGRFVADATTALQALQEDIAILWFGHIADSNLHICVRQDPGGPSKRAIDEAVYRCVGDYGGSISAEHGIGLLKKPYLGHSRSPAELAVMRRLKTALDPRGILNPGKVLDV